jgi:hypothetical protein
MESESPEVTEEQLAGKESEALVQPDALDVGRLAILASLLQSAHKDPVAREAIYAGLRTAINVTIGIGDLGPVIGALAGTLGMPGVGTTIGGALGTAGEGASFIADGWKGLVRSVQYLTLGKVRLPDLTPDVGLIEAAGTEVFDAATGSMLPSHLLFEARHQFQADKPRIQQAWSEARGRAATKKAERTAAKDAFLVGRGK